MNPTLKAQLVLRRFVSANILKTYTVFHNSSNCVSLFIFVVLPLKLLDRFHDTLIQSELAEYFSLLVTLLERLLHN